MDLRYYGVLIFFETANLVHKYALSFNRLRELIKVKYQPGQIEKIPPRQNGGTWAWIPLLGTLEISQQHFIRYSLELSILGRMCEKPGYCVPHRLRQTIFIDCIIELTCVADWRKAKDCSAPRCCNMIGHSTLTPSYILRLSMALMPSPANRLCEKPDCKNIHDIFKWRGVVSRITGSSTSDPRENFSHSLEAEEGLRVRV